MDTETMKKIYEDLKDLGCCDRCTIRYMNPVDEEYEVYEKPEEYLSKIMVDAEPIAPKRRKENPCRTCLNILQSTKLDSIIEGIVKSDISEYNYNDFTISFTFPKTIFLRNHAMSIYLKNKYADKSFDKILPFHKTLKKSTIRRLEKILNKKATTLSIFDIAVHINYDDDDEEILPVMKLDKQVNNKKVDLISRHVITNVLSSVADDDFTKHFSVPPDIPTKEAELLKTVCNAGHLYIGGRYLKFTRDMGQTTWILDGAKVTEFCVQDIIFDAIRNVLGITSKLVFSASGREDYDVRMLGNGRPFYIEIHNPKSYTISSQKLRDVEMYIQKSKKVKVLNLQTLFNRDIALIKEGENFKNKSYRALCVGNTLDLNTVIDTINTFGPVLIQQKTPIRVAHRRAMLIRPRKIYSMIASKVSDRTDVFQLDLTTQAGTYVKEFVHGDLGRTVPNLSGIAGCALDVAALDVTNIDLNWPPNAVKE